MPNPLENQVAVVTGAGSGIGRAVALALGRSGAVVWLVGRDRGKLEATREDLGEGGRVFPADLAREEDLEGLVEAVTGQEGRADILVHAAGAIALGLVDATSGQDLDRQYRVNLRGPFVLTRLLLPWLERTEGQIVFVNSSAGLAGKAQVAAYSATKHGLRGFADSLRLEVNRRGIRVVSVFPGNTATPMQDTVQDYTGRALDTAYLLQPEDVADSVVHTLLLPRTAEVTDLQIRPFRSPPT